MVYLDNAATTAVCPAAAAAALAAMTADFGNPSARYPLGQAAAQKLAEDRAAVAAALGCLPEELCFTSCGTEGDNWAVRSALEYGKRRGKHIITTAIEHSAVIEPCKALEQAGYEVTYLRPDKKGQVSLSDFRSALRPDTVLVSMMLVNNELGSLQPVAETAAAIKSAASPALLHCDAVQGFLKIPFTPRSLGVDLLSISGHKVHAPKGIGALYIRKGLRLPPLLLGGGQEHALRPGTEPTAQISAFAAACQLGQQNFVANTARILALKQYALASLFAALPELELICDGAAPHILALTLPGYKSEVLVRVLGDMGICVSAGSACHKGKPSHVYAALDLSKPRRDGAFRVSFSAENTPADVDALRQALLAAKAQLLPALS